MADLALVSAAMVPGHPCARVGAWVAGEAAQLAWVHADGVGSCASYLSCISLSAASAV